MKFNIFFLLFLFLLYGCAPNEIKKDSVTSEQQIENKARIEQVNVGWLDSDTYTVKVISENLETGKEKAKHQILLDIIKVRMMNESRFTDIAKINAEFEKPLKNGKIISEKKVENGIEIYFQIKDEGLKKKFEKK